MRLQSCASAVASSDGKRSGIVIASASAMETLLHRVALVRAALVLEAPWRPATFRLTPESLHLRAEAAAVSVITSDRSTAPSSGSAIGLPARWWCRCRCADKFDRGANLHVDAG